MADIISNFPDSILCYILSFLPTKQVVATSVLSKRWNHLWLSVPSLDLDYEGRSDDTEVRYGDEEACCRFLLSAYSCLLWRNMDQPFNTLRFRCWSPYNHNEIEKWIKLAMRRSGRLEHLDLDIYIPFAVPSVVFSCKTLVVLKLAKVTLKNISFVDLPLLKILHIINCSLENPGLLPLLLSESPNLEDLVVKYFMFNDWVVNTAEEFNRLPKLVRADVDLDLIPMQIVKNVQVLMTDRVLEVLKHCPKLQTLSITICQEEGDEEALLPCLDPVPACILLHLRTCCLKNYSGSEFEFQFAEYIMKNANYLRIMEFCIDSLNPSRRDDMIRDLSSCMKISDTCTLSFV